MSLRSKLVIFASILVLIIALVLSMVILHEIHQQELAKLRNQVAQKDTTLEVQKGLYTRLSQEADGLKNLLDGRDSQIAILLEQTKRQHEDLLTANKVALKWREAYQARGDGSQINVVENEIARKRVEFSRVFGNIRVDGWTLTDPPEYSLRLDQIKPLTLTVAMSQGPDGSWRSYVLSDDPDISAEIQVSAVNSYILQPHWYQRIRLHGFVAGGLNEPGFGIIAGGGVSYEFGRYEIGPMMFVTATDRLDRYLGLAVAWRMF